MQTRKENTAGETVSHPDQFYKDLLTHLGLDDGAFRKIIKEMATKERRNNKLAVIG